MKLLTKIGKQSTPAGTLILQLDAKSPRKFVCSYIADELRGIGNLATNGDIAINSQGYPELSVGSGRAYTVFLCGVSRDRDRFEIDVPYDTNTDSLFATLAEALTNMKHVESCSVLLQPNSVGGKLCLQVYGECRPFGCVSQSAESSTVTAEPETDAKWLPVMKKIGAVAVKALTPVRVLERLVMRKEVLRPVLFAACLLIPLVVVDKAVENDKKGKQKRVDERLVLVTYKAKDGFCQDFVPLKDAAAFLDKKDKELAAQPGK